MGRKDRLSCEEVRGWDLISWLANLGFEPAKVRGNDFWYLSPFRNERTASFKVNRSINRWYDFGEGVGGSLIDFAIRYMDCTVGEFMTIINSKETPKKYKPSQTLKTGTAISVEVNTIQVVKVLPLYSDKLIEYISGRGIHRQLADRYLKQVYYRCNGRDYFALGFQNDKGGWELRTAYFKGSSSPKFLTHLNNNKSSIAVFEGFIDFLSFLQLMTGNEILSNTDFLILNSLSFVLPGIGILQHYNEVSLFLDNDKAGDKHTLIFKTELEQAEDKRSFYKSNKDLNEFLCARINDP